MRLTIERDAALDAVSAAMGPTPSANTIPILGDLLLDAREGRLRVRGASAEMQRASDAEADVEREGAATAPARRLHDVLKTLPSGGQVRLELLEGGARVAVACGRSRFQLPTMPSDRFPAMPVADDGVRATLPAKLLARLLEKTQFAIGKDQTRYYLTGIHLHPFQPGEGAAPTLRAVATNGAVLGMVEVPCPEGWAEASALSIPDRAVGELLRLASAERGEVEIAADTVFAVRGDGEEFVTQLLDGRFPDYRRVIPDYDAAPFEMSVAAFSASLRRCLVMADDESRMVRLDLRAGEARLLSRGVGTEAEDMVACAYAGPDLERGFNAKYLLDILGRIEGETVSVHLGGGHDPAKFTDPAAPDCTFVLMPLRS